MGLLLNGAGIETSPELIPAWRMMFGRMGLLLNGAGIETESGSVVQQGFSPVYGPAP